MPFEYSVVPAPKKGQKAKGVRSAEDRFAYALQQIMNDKGAEGWEYVRTDTLPSEERQGLTGSKTVYQNVMVFKRAITVAEPAVEPPTALLAAPTPEPEPEDDDPIEPPSFITREEPGPLRLDDAAVEAEDPLRAEPTFRRNT